tara:strand:+ start:341 stop:592 length:252 start_codon:yes stop_codon:yes gene_type:complete
MKTTKSFKTGEFWISIIGMIGGAVFATMEGNQWTQIIGAIMAAVCGSSYTMGRSLVKSSESKATIISEAIKKSPSLILESKKK